MIWPTLIAAGVALLLTWAVLVGVLFVAGRRLGDPVSLGEVLRLVPDVIRLVRRLAADQALPRGARIRLTLLAVYLISPVDLVPDFVPFLGYADDAVVVVLTLRSVVRRAGPQVLERNWPGTPEGLRALRRLCGIA